MAKPDQRQQIFDLAPGELKKFEAGTPTSASHLNKLVDAANEGRIGVGAPEQVTRTRRGSSIDFGLIRGWPVAGGDLLDVSLIARNAATGTWLIPEEATIEVVCSAGRQARDYASFQWIGQGGEIYPLALPRQITVLALPIVSVGSDLMALFVPPFVIPDPLPANSPVSDGWHSEGESEVSFGITP